MKSLLAAPVDGERGEGVPRVRLHGLEDVVGLVGHGLAGSAHETGPVGATGDARDEAAGGGAAGA